MGSKKNGWVVMSQQNKAISINLQEISENSILSSHRMKLEADSLLSLEKDSHCVKREESHKLADWKIKYSVAT